MNVRRLRSVPLCPLVRIPTDDNIKQLHRKINQYSLLKTIGHGANCKVVLLQDSSTRNYYAAKVFSCNRRFHKQLPFEREVRIMKNLDHDSIVKLQEVLYVQQKNQYYMIMEWGNCGSLQDIIDSKIKLSNTVISSIFKQLACALSYLHEQGFVHQDIKPSNVLIFSDGLAKIADFGIGHSFGSADTVVGTPAYQSPEIFDDCVDECGKLPVLDPSKGDIWSLGVTLYQVVFGILPFSGNTVFEIVRSIKENGLFFPEDISSDLFKLISGMLDPNPETRFTLEQILSNPFFKDAPERFTPPINPIEPPKPNMLLPISQLNASVYDDSILLESKSTDLFVGAWDNIIEHRSI